MRNEPELSVAGYTILVGLQADQKTTIIRKEDGFENRILYRCVRCRLVVGYEIASGTVSQEMDVGARDGGRAGSRDVYTGKVLYLLPGGIMSTEVMSKGGVFITDDGRSEKKIGEGDLDIVGRRGVKVFE